jgi:hypothetical protein
VTGLSPGNHVFTAKYRGISLATNFGNRSITVVPIA